MNPPPPEAERIFNDIGVSRETLSRLTQYVELLSKWQSHINLVASTDNLWNRHIIDSLGLLPYLPQEPCTIIDLGSGGGFPGIILSICTPHSIHLIESDQRKASFLKEALRITNAHGAVHTQRIEDTSLKCDLITARACASTERLLSLSTHLWSPHVTGLFMKGKQVQNEIEEAQRHWHFHYKILPHPFSPGGNILSINGVGKL